MLARPPLLAAGLLLFPLFAMGKLTAADTAERLSYSQDVRPILSDKCFFCHGPDENTREAGLRLDTETGMLADLGGYAAIVPGNAEESEVMLRVLSSDADLRMPPAHAHKDLSEQEIDTLRRWIAEGAEFEMHWSYRPLQRPIVPVTAQASHPIDALIASKWDSRGLLPAPPADPETLVRRLYLDLLGVPPTSAEVTAYVSNPSAQAYEQLLAKLLNDPRFGERMAVYWLDLVRYADTIGYHSDNHMEVSAYRDYVIDAFNSNMPFDQFTIEQLAGDLLPEPTEQQRIASGYNRLLQTTEEGGAQAKEYIAIYAADRVRNVSGVWMGSTVGCAQCHDHKYDPFTAKDFYAMSAFFADIKETAVGKQSPNMKLFSDQQRAELAAIDQQVAGLEESMRPESSSTLAATVSQDQAAWEQALRAQDTPDVSPWTVPTVQSLEATADAKLQPQADGSILHTGGVPPQADFKIRLQTSGTLRAVRLEVFSDPSFPVSGGLSRGNGNFVLTDFNVLLDGQSVPLADAQADFSQDGHPVTAAIDEDPKSGWAVSGHQLKVERRVAVFTLKEPLELGDQVREVQIELQHQSQYPQHAVGRFRLALTATESAPLDAAIGPPAEILEIVAIEPQERSEAQRGSLASFYRGISPALKAAAQQIEQLKTRRSEIEKQARTMLVAEALPQPRMTRILPRGNWLDDSGEVVQPAVPEFLAITSSADVDDAAAGGSEEARLTRLDLAHWLTDASNPLTARTLVNRLWSLFYGRGLSRNLDDLGGQGQPPTHPELLDWLAMELQDSGWDVKHVIALMLSSDAYRRSSVPTEAQKKLDLRNDWLARQGRWRLDAEFVRDTALQISGLLVDENIGGQSVKPYQPAGYWQHLNFPQREWQASDDEGLYRRSLYTFWCRSFLHPSMLAFDAPSREECTAQRTRSNIPQQALVLLNDPIFVEASRVFAQRIATQAGTPQQRVEWACREAFNREASEQETALLVQLYEKQLQRFADDPAAAQQLLQIGQASFPADANPGELAAWTQVARALLNTYETISRY